MKRLTKTEAKKALREGAKVKRTKNNLYLLDVRA